jgi:hypothetical protein
VRLFIVVYMWHAHKPIFLSDFDMLLVSKLHIKGLAKCVDTNIGVGLACNGMIKSKGSQHVSIEQCTIRELIGLFV